MEETVIATLSPEEVLAQAKRERKNNKRLADKDARLRGIAQAKEHINTRSNHDR